jgi:DNA-binding NarL/FixJ family response regulator
MKVLIADDNALMRSFIRSLIMDMTADIHEAVDGSSAVLWAKENAPDLILMDIRMPGIDGIEATRRIMLENPATNIVIVTEFDTRDYRCDALKAGAIAYVLKDNLTELPETLANILYLN